MKLIQIEKYLRDARIAKNSIHIAFYSTLKGEVETEMKRSSKPETNIIEEIAKKWNKNLHSFPANLQTQEEIKLLLEFLPQLYNRDQTIAQISICAENNNELFTSSALIKKLKTKVMNKFDVLETDLHDYFEKLKRKYPNDAELGKFIRNN